MIALEFDSQTWGSQRKAIAARAKRAKALEDEGYEVDYATRYYGYGDNRGYRLFAHKSTEIKMEVPASKMLTDETIRVGMRVEVWQHPNVQTVPYQGERGTVQDTSYLSYCNMVDVALDGYGSQPIWIPVGHLIEAE